MVTYPNGPVIRAGLELPVSALLTVVVDGASGLAATYWDDGWYTEIGRDSAFIPPHLLLYGSIGVVLAGWVPAMLWRNRSMRATLTTLGLVLAVAPGCGHGGGGAG